MKPNTINCCKDCTHRRVGCHADCPDYRREKAALMKRPVDEAYKYFIRKRRRILHYLHQTGKNP